MGCPETSVRNYGCWLRNNTEERYSQGVTRLFTSKIVERGIIMDLLLLFALSLKVFSSLSRNSVSHPSPVGLSHYWPSEIWKKETKRSNVEGFVRKEVYVAYNFVAVVPWTHPAYSPDLSSSDCHLLSALMQNHVDCNIKDGPKLGTVVTLWLITRDAGVISTGDKQIDYTIWHFFLCSWVHASWISVNNCTTRCDYIQFIIFL